MSKLVIFCVLAFLAHFGVSDKSCPGGYQDGNQFESGRYWYECKEGQVIPRGCLSDTGRRVEIQDTFDTSENRMQCVLDSDGYLAILYKSCVYNGREQMVNERWDDGKIWYTCKKDGSAVRADPIGCVDDNRQISFNDRVVRGNSVYSCRKTTSGRVEMARSGCAFQGEKYNIGETYQSSQLWYTCTDSGSKIIGCIHQGLQLRDGDLFHESDVIFQCTVNDEKTGPVAFGCLMRENGIETEKKFGCFWTEGEAPYQYEFTCKFDKEKNTAIKAAVKCTYKTSEGSFNVAPGCVVVGNSLAVGCLKDGNSERLSTKTFPADKIDYSLGLRDC